MHLLHSGRSAAWGMHPALTELQHHPPHAPPPSCRCIRAGVLVRRPAGGQRRQHLPRSAQSLLFNLPGGHGHGAGPALLPRWACAVQCFLPQCLHSRSQCVGPRRSAAAMQPACMACCSSQQPRCPGQAAPGAPPRTHPPAAPSAPRPPDVAKGKAATQRVFTIIDRQPQIDAASQVRCLWLSRAVG